MSVLSRIFGDFPAAGAFHRAVSAAHAHHVRMLQGHQATLNGIGVQAHEAASSFTEMENHNAKALKAVRCSYKT